MCVCELCVPSRESWVVFGGGCDCARERAGVCVLRKRVVSVLARELRFDETTYSKQLVFIQKHNEDSGNKDGPGADICGHVALNPNP